MKDLMTRRIILGMLMVLVLAFSVQGTADAIDTFTPTFTPTDLNMLRINNTVVVGGITGKTPNVTGHTPNIPNVREYITVSVSGSGVGTGATSTNFVNPTDSTKFVTTYTWDETDVDGNATIDHNNAGTFDTNDAPAPVTINIRRAGEITVTVTYSETYQDSGGIARRRHTSVVSTYYVVKQAFQVGLNDRVSLLGVSNGVGAGYGETDNFRIHSGDGRNNRVTYTLGGTGGELYIREGSRYRNAENSAYIQSATSGNTLTTSSSAEVWLDMGTTSHTVTATVSTNQNETEAVYILRVPRLAVGTRRETLSVDTEPTPLTGDPEEVIGTDAIRVQVMQSSLSGETVVFTTPVTDVLVKFDVVDKSVTGGYLIPDSSTTIVDSRNIPIKTADIPSAARTLYVRTDDSNGDSNTANVGFQFGTAEGTSEIIVSVVGTRVNIRKTVDVVIGADTSERLSISSNTKKSDGFHLVARVVDKDDRPIWGKTVTFRTRFGNLENTPTGETGISNPDPTESEPTINDDAPKQDGLRVTDITTRSGLARVVYGLGSNTGRQEIHASINDHADSRQEVTFVVNGGAAPTPPTPPADTTDDEDDEDDEDAGTLIVFPSSLSGAPGAVVQMSVSPSTATVVGDVAFIVGGGLVSGTATARNVTLPDTAGSYNLTASATGYENVTVPVTVGTGTGTGTDTQPGTLTITTVGDRVGTQQQIRVTVRDAANALAAGAVTVTLTGALNPPTVSTLNGTGTVVTTLPTATGAHTLTVSATGYGTSSVTVPATGSQPPAQQQPQPVGQASSIRLASEPFPSGTANTQLAQPLRVQVLDANNNGVANVRVIFRVVSGQGRLSQRGNGRAVAVQTNVSGEARAPYTPLSAASTVRATAASVSQTVTFTISAGSAPPPTTTPSTPDTDVTPSREIRPVVQVNASQRPPMLWVDGGSIYALVGASVQKFASGVDNALNIAVGGGKVYWTEKTGDSGGTINSANLNGSNVQELASILAVPMGIAVGSDKLYWTNSRGRIQSANLDGSGITNVIPGGLEGAMDIAVAGGNAYWTQGGNVRFVNLTGQKQIRDISTGMDTANSLAIGGGKVYWAEMTGESAGTVNSANLNGTGATELASISAVPSGIAVDTARSKLYWTNSRGRIQRANLNGSGIGNVVTGLGNPGDMVSSNSITAPAATPPTTTTTAPAPKKYDVNGDGTVDSKDVDAIIVAVAAKITDAKYDVTGDGTVDINDVVAVSANQDTGAAAAPALLGTQLSSVQIDRLQEQIDLLIASNDRSPDALRILTYLQQLIVMARPEKTQLLGELSESVQPRNMDSVRVGDGYGLFEDHDLQCTKVLSIRTLALGHQSAGYYTGRDRAAYWDGRNALGEQVASGIYFYQFETDEMSSMRKMVILK